MRMTCPFCRRVFKDDPHEVYTFDRLPAMTVRDQIITGTFIAVAQCPDCKAVRIEVSKGQYEDYGYCVRDVNGWYAPEKHNPLRCAVVRLLDSFADLANETRYKMIRKRHIDDNSAE